MGFLVKDDGELGMRRLSVIDLASGKQLISKKEDRQSGAVDLWPSGWKADRPYSVVTGRPRKLTG